MVPPACPKKREEYKRERANREFEERETEGDKTQPSSTAIDDRAFPNATAPTQGMLSPPTCLPQKRERGGGGETQKERKKAWKKERKY